jgi:two-component system cell cycle response regulator
MSARVLVVDDVPANVKLLQARLNAEYFEVVAASSGPEAIELCAKGDCDIVLLDVMMPGMDGFEVCRVLKADPRTMHLPVIMITALDSTEDRVAGLEAGADDFLSKPVNDLALTTRVRSLVRLKMLGDELGARAATSRQLALEPRHDHTLVGRILLVDDRESSRAGIVAGLARQQHQVVVEADPAQSILLTSTQDFDLAIVSLELSGHDGLRLCAQFRSIERTRTLPILVIDAPANEPRLIRALEIGVNDYLVRPIDRNEMLARVRTQIRRKR